MATPYRSGAVAVIGKPNVGKSTLTNLLVGQKVSIVSDKKQTTRKQVRGILTTQEYQIVLVDTPGVHEAHTELQKIMNESARGSLSDVDLVLVMVDASKKPDKEDEALADLVRKSWEYPWADENPGSKGILICLNKMDRLKAEDVAEHVEAFCKLFGTEEYMMTCLTKRQNFEKLLNMMVERLPEGEPLFPEEMVTDTPLRYLAAEFIREKALMLTTQEVPHALGCLIDLWEEQENGITHIMASLICEKDGQKAILIGKQGSMAKKIGTQARADIEELLGGKVHLELHVKVRPEWRQNPRMLHELDYL